MVLACPRCQSRIVNVPDDDGEYDCVVCGERWPDPVMLARKQALMDAEIAQVRAVPGIGHDRHQQPLSTRIIDVLVSNPDGLTVSMIAIRTGAKHEQVERATWRLYASRQLAVANDRGPLRWRLAS